MLTGQVEQSRVEELIERVATELVRRRLGVLAIVLLEAGKPLTLAGSQTLVFLEPVLGWFLTLPDYETFVALLEDRQRVEQLIQAIERRVDGRG